jgi:hypothetical protein
MAWHGMALMLLLLAGCAPMASPVDREVEALVRSLHESSENSDTSEYIHDFGPILARGQTLRHEFSLRNPGDTPLRILGAEALTPCCSAVDKDKLPEAVPPGGEAKVPVVFRPGHQSGRKQVQFAVKTDDESNPVRLFSLRASLLSQLEVELLPRSDTTLLLGQSGKQRLRVTCRRIGDGGLAAPESVKASPGLSASFTGDVQEQAHPDGLIETTRELEVSLPLANETGWKAADVILRWPSRMERGQRVSWQVKPCIEAFPAGIVLKESNEAHEQTIRLISNDRPFRVLEVDGAKILEEKSPGSTALVHELLIEIDGAKYPDNRAKNLLFHTDHSQQPSVQLPLLRLGGARDFRR